MNADIGCGICRDLLPLVRDGVASEESEAAVKVHLAHCAACRSLLDGTPPPLPDGRELLRRTRRKARSLVTLVLLLGVLLGLGLTSGADMFYNSLLMPALGAAAYCVYHWRALYKLPLMLVAAHFFCWLLQMIWGMEAQPPLPGLAWVAIYGVLAYTGILIAGLFHFALRKEGK